MGTVIHPGNCPTYEGAWSYMHLEPASPKQLAVIRQQIRRVGDWPTREDDLARILGVGWEPGTPLDRLSKAGASYLMFELDRGWHTVTADEPEEVGT